MDSQSLSEALRTTLAIFDEAGVPWTTPEVAEQLDLGRRATYARLEQLVESDHLHTKNVGASARVWWRPPSDEFETERPDGRDGTDGFDSLLEQQRDPIFATDGNGEFRWWNASFREATGYADAEIAELELPEIFDAETSERGADATARVLDDGEPVHGDILLTTADGTTTPYESSWAPLTDEQETVTGMLAICRLASEPTKQDRQRERTPGRFTGQDGDTDSTPQSERNDHGPDLRQYATLVEAVCEPIYALDLDGRFTYVNQAFTELAGYEEEEILGQHVSIGIEEEAISKAESKIRGLLANEREVTATLEYDIVTKDGDRIPVENRISLVTDEDGQVTGTAGVIWDVTARKERAFELERALNLLNAAERIADVGGWEIYPDSTEIYWSDYLFDLLEISSEDEPPLDEALNVYHEDDRPLIEDAIQSAFDRGDPIDVEARYRTGDGDVRWLHVQGQPATVDGEAVSLRGAAQDITQRKERERELETRVRQQEVVADLGQSALEDRDLDGLMADAAALVADTLENEYCKVLDLTEGTDELLLRQGVGWTNDIVGEATVSAVEADSQAAYTLTTAGPIVVENLETESRFSGPDLLTDHDVKSGISVVIGPPDNPWGILGTHCTEPQVFDAHDVNFVQSVANVLSTAIDQHGYEQRLHRQREELIALNNLNEIVSEITETVIHHSTREEIEQTVCDKLAATNSYKFAWLAGICFESDTFTTRASANTSGYQEAISISLDPDDPGSQGPGATAAREQTTQVIQDVFADPRFEPWRDAAAEYGFRSVASIPLVHEETVYGVLGVYADRANAFDTTERKVISRLGEVVGHAIASVERKHALISRDVVELTFRIRDVFDELALPSEPGGTITITEIVPISDGEFLMYGTATAEARESMDATVEVLPRWESLTYHDEEEDTTFEIHVTDHPVLSTLASIGGSLEEAVIEEGDFRLTVQLSRSANPTRLLEAVQECYPGIEMVTRRQTTRTEGDVQPIHTVMDELTDRQQTVLRAAYHSGYFEWPRDRSGEDVASSLGIAPPTLHYHLRTAERKILEAALAPQQA